MRTTWVVIAAGLLASACAARAPAPTTGNSVAGLAPGTIEWPSRLDHPSTLASHEQAAFDLLDVAGMSTALDATIEATLTQQLELQPSIRPFEAVMRAFLTKYMSYQSLRDDMAALYMRTFDELQLRQLCAFYRTDIGVAAIKQLPGLIAAGGRIGSERVTAHMDELQAMIQAALAAQQP